MPGYGGWVNDSGTGAMARLPQELSGFNWGAFLMHWMWAVGNKSYIGLLCFVPYVGVIMHFVLGFKGNEWAWQNRRWDSIEHFRSVQRIWAMWGLGFLIVGIIFVVIGAVLGAFSGHSSSSSY